MPRVGGARIVSARKRLLGGLAIVALLAFAGGGFAVWMKAKTPGYNTTTLKTPSRSFELLVADTPEKQRLGLGQRGSLAANQGMVFPYEEPGRLCFWMKDMRFSIDMIWLDAAKTVLQIEQDVSPATYPKDFCSKQPAQYVVELNANTALPSGIKVGDRLQF